MTTITMPETIGGINIDELTSADGKGVLDVMLGSIKTLLHAEYKENRIRGTDYANAFVQLIPAVLQQAGMYSLAKAKLPLELQLLEKEAQKADVDIQLATKQLGLTDAQIQDILKGVDIKDYQLTKQMPIEVANLTKQGSQLDAQTQSITKETEIKSYQLSTQLPVETANLSKQGVLLDKQASQVTTQTEAMAYELANKAPLEVEMLGKQADQVAAETVNVTKQGLLLTEQTKQTTQQTTNMVAEKSRIEADTARVTYETAQVLPKQLQQTDAQITQVSKQTDLLAYELSNLKPKELAVMTEQVNVAKQEVALKTKQVEITDYELKHKLPVELEQMTAQTIKIVSDVNNTIKEGKLVDANRCRVNAETAMVTANLNQKLPKEIANMDKDLLIKQSQIDLGVKELALKEQQVAVTVKELGIKDVELKLADYQFKYKAPVEVKKEQAEADYYKYRASSEQAQTDPSAILPGSVLDKNNKVLDEQSRQYLRSSQQTMLSSMLDTWKVRHNADPNDIGNAVDDENKLNDLYIGKIVTAVGNEVGITL